MINLTRLITELKTTLPSVVGLLVAQSVHETIGPSTFHQRPIELVRADWSPAPTQQQIDQAEAIIQAHDASASAELVWIRNQSADLIDKGTDKPDDTVRLLRSIVLILRNENNLLRQRMVDQDAVIATFTGGTAAAAIADLKSKWAAAASNNPMPQRSISDAKTAIKNKAKDPESD